MRGEPMTKKAQLQNSTISDISLELLSDRIPAMIGVYSPVTGHYDYVNPAVKKILGYTPEEFIVGGIEFVVSLVHPDDLPGILKKNEAAIKKVLAAKPGTVGKDPIVNFEYRMKHKHGHWVWLHTDGSVYDWTPDGRIKHLLNVSIDITERKESERKLQQLAAKLESRVKESSVSLKAAEAARDASEEKYRSFIRVSTEGIWRFELEKPLQISKSIPAQIKHMYKYAYLAEANEAMAKMYGFSSSNSLVGQRLGDLLHEDSQENKAYLTAFIKSGYRLSGVESHEKDKKGRDKYFSNSLVGIVEDGKLVRAWGTQQDITAQHAAMVAVRHSEERLALAMRVSQMGTWEWDVETGELHWPPELKRLFGLKASEKITYEKFMELIHPEERTYIQKIIATAMKTGKPYQFNHRVTWPDGTLHWLQGQGQAFYEDNKLVRMLGTTRDITEQKEAEEALQKSEQLFKNLIKEQTALVELNDAKDEFISLASHQLRTPATGVKQFIGMLLENYFGELTEDQRTMLEYAYESNERQLEVINDLLKVAQVDAGKVVLSKQKSDLADMLEDIMQEQRAQFAKRKQKVLLDRPKAPVYASVDPSRIRMVIENLIDNASKYTPSGKHITVSINPSKSGEFVNIKVEDEGVGISEEDIPKLFQKFSRLENPLSIQVGGTGIGLYWAKKIVDLHGGTITLRSRQGKGTTFIVKIPA